MRVFFGCLILFAVLIGSSRACADGKAHAEQVQRLIRQLGSTKYAERQAASQQLLELGATALKALQDARLSEDLEVRLRARQLVLQLQRRLETAQALAAPPVRLVCKETPLGAAVADLARQSGFAIHLEDDLGGLAERKITLDTGPTTFWRALDQLCHTAGLVESAELPEIGEGDPGKPDNRVVLVKGQPSRLPTFHAGALRIRSPARAADPLPKVGPDTTFFLLEARPAATLAWDGVVGVRILKAVDDKGQFLTQPSTGTGFALSKKAMQVPGADVFDAYTGHWDTLPGNPRTLFIPLQTAKHPSKVLKELQGTLLAQVQVFRPVASVDNILQAVGKKVEASTGGPLTILAVARQADGTVQVQITVEGLGHLARFVRVRPGFVAIRGSSTPTADHFALQDKDGRGFRLTRVEQDVIDVKGKPFGQEYRLTYQPSPGQGEAFRFIFSGQRPLTIEVPFTLKEVPLP
jgi:hypothetical protein